MDLRKYKYIRNVKPQYDAGKSSFAPFQPGSTNTSMLQFNTEIGPKAPSLNTLSSALNPASITNISKSGGPSPISALSQAGFGQKLTAGFNVASNAIGQVMNKIPVMQGINFAQNLGNAFSTKNIVSTDELSQNAGSSEGTVNGISYERMNRVDGSDELEALKSQNKANVISTAMSGASLGSKIAGPVGGIIGGIGGFIGGIFGGNRRKKELERRIREAQRLNNRMTSYNLSSADTKGLQQNYYKENEDNSGDILYANRGKDMNKVWTPAGYRRGATNSMVGKGESIVNFNRGTGTLITKGQRGVDNQPSSVSPNDDNVILGNDIDWSNGMKFADQAAPYTAALEMLNKYVDRTKDYDKKSSLSRRTMDVQQREINKRKQPILDALGNISARQQMQHQIENKQALRGFDDGKDKDVLKNLWMPQNPLNLSLNSFNNSIKNNAAPYMVMPYTSTSQSSTSPVTEPTTMQRSAVKTTTKPDTKSKSSNGFFKQLGKLVNNANNNSDLIPTWQRIMPSAFGFLQSWNQYNTYDKEPIRYTNMYRSNPYASNALRGLASLRYDMYPELSAIRNAGRRGAYSVDMAGGLSGGQRVAARIANNIATQRNLSNVYANASAQNNKYKAAYYDALMKAGEADRSARMTAAQQDYQNYVAAHGAKYKGRDTAVANMIDQMNNWYANEFKYKTYRDTADIYRQELDDKRKALAAGYNSSKATNNNPTTTAINYSSLFPSVTQQPAQTFNTPFGSVPIWNNPLDWSFKNLMRYAS